MGIKRKYKITIVDEPHLSEVWSGRMSTLGMAGIAALLLLVAFVLAFLVVTLTPMRNLLPGYLKDSQRAATEEGLLRLDSLMAAYEVNQAYLLNYIEVLDENRQPADSLSVPVESRELSPDSLQGASARERRFLSQMEERERFNVSVLAPLAADGVMFSPIAAEGVFSSSSKGSEEGEILLTEEESVKAAADGSVIALYHSGLDRGYVVLIQHGKGFAIGYKGLGRPLVGLGDRVSAGQVIALSPEPDANGVRRLKVRMWHNGLALIPYEYLNDPAKSKSKAEAGFEAPRGR